MNDSLPGAACQTPPDYFPTHQTLSARFHERHGDLSKHGWRVRMRAKFGYHDSDAWYEAVVDGLVTNQTVWLDVGGGKHIFPFNRPLGKSLASRCNYLSVVDPAEGIESNFLGHERAQCLIENYCSDKQFDLATLRMVAEHIESPGIVVSNLAKLIRPGGKVVICTPWKWSPVALAAAIMPYRLHMPISRFLWGTNDDDVFPVVYRMNTRNALNSVFAQHGFGETCFSFLPNCTTFHRFRWSCYAELTAWRGMQSLGIRYPECNLLAVYERL